MWARITGQQLETELQPAGVVHREYLHRGPAYRRAAFNPHASKLKVVTPSVTPRMEKAYQFAGCWIDACEIGAFPEIATVASQREVLNIVEAAMLLGDNMLDVVG